MRAAIYLRVSTSDQDTELQRAELVRYCEYNNLQYDIFEDRSTGTNTKRPKLQEMLDAIDGQVYSKCIVWRLDRFSRSISDLVVLLSRLHAGGCAFVSIREHIDFSTAVGRMQAQLLGVFAEFEAAIIGERTKAGMRAKMALGMRPGRKPRPLDMNGYEKMKSRGMSVDEIARKLGLSRSQLYRRLSA